MVFTDYVERLKGLCGEAYFAVGALAEGMGVFDAPEVQRVLDNLSDAANGQTLRHDTLLPLAQMVKPEIKMCHGCRRKNGYELISKGAQTAQVLVCSGCGEKKMILPSRHWVKK